MEILSITEMEPEEAKSELVRDLLDIVTSFSVRLYGAGGGRKKSSGFGILIAGVGSDEEAENDEIN